jgi:hypothetical protein
MVCAAKKFEMNPRLPPADPIVATMTISLVVMRVRERQNAAKKKSAAIAGPSSMIPNESVRYEFMAQSTIARTSPAMKLRNVNRCCTTTPFPGET